MGGGLNEAVVFSYTKYGVHLLTPSLTTFVFQSMVQRSIFFHGSEMLQIEKTNTKLLGILIFFENIT